MTYDIIHEGQLNPRLNVCVFVKKKGNLPKFQPLWFDTA